MGIHKQSGRKSFAKPRIAKTPKCPKCGRKAKATTGAALGLHIHRDAQFLACVICKTAVRVVTRGGYRSKPAGQLATVEVRAARRNAHRVFDKIWQSGVMSRKQAYAWLGDMLGLPSGKCHIGAMSLEDLQQTVALLDGVEMRV